MLWHRSVFKVLWVIFHGFSSLYKSYSHSLVLQMHNQVTMHRPSRRNNKKISNSIKKQKQGNLQTNKPAYASSPAGHHPRLKPSITFLVLLSLHLSFFFNPVPLSSAQPRALWCNLFTYISCLNGEAEEDGYGNTMWSIQTRITCELTAFCSDKSFSAIFFFHPPNSGEGRRERER